MNIQDIKDFNDSNVKSILAAGAKIHNRLFSRLGYDDIIDPSFNDDSIRDKFFTLENKISAYKKELHKLERDYINYIMIELHKIGIAIGFNIETGNNIEINDIKNRLYEKVDIIFSAEFEPIYESIHTILQPTLFIPFWRHDDYTITTKYETIFVESGSSPSNFIEKNKNKFKQSRGRNQFEILKDAILIEKSSSYKFSTPKIDVFAKANNFIESVNRHILLKELLDAKNKSGVYYTTSGGPLLNKIDPQTFTKFEDLL